MTIGKTRHKLMALSGDAFANEVEALMGVLSERVAQSRRLGLLDRQGIDVFVYRDADQSVEIAIQCKGYERPFESDQVFALLGEIEKFSQKGPDVKEYWLTINRPIADRNDRNQVETALAGLKRTGKCQSTRLLDLDQLTQFLLERAKERIIGWVNAFRDRSIAEFRGSMGVVDYITGVPFEHEQKLGADPSKHILTELKDFRKSVNPSNTGPYRISPRILLTASFGYGKTSTLQEIAKGWMESGGVALYLPAALLPPGAFTHTAGALESFLDILLPDDEVPNAIAMLFIREAWKKLIRRSNEWLLLIDAIDECDFWSEHDRLSALWAAVWQLGVPAVVSVRDEVYRSRPVEFSYTSGQRKGDAFFSQISLLEWEKTQILGFLSKFETTRTEAPSAGFIRLRDIVQNDEYERVFGDIPRRPLFLGMLAEDAWDREQPEARLDRLYDRFFRKKLIHDRFSSGARGRVVRTGTVFRRFGEEEGAERLLRAMTTMAVDLFNESNWAGDTTILEFDEEFLRRKLTNQVGDIDEIEEITLNSLIMPLGRRNEAGQRLYRFAHKSYQDWLIARGLATQDALEIENLPDSVAYFAKMMRVD
ncbi:MAG: hypothetical protein AAGK79_13405 [Pseudomonadota bacterium]